MTIHSPRVPTAQEVVAATDREIPRSLKTTFAVLFGIGVIIFIIGLFAAPDRVWSAWHANWLFWATLSNAGVVFVCVQRITTARWSRQVIRFMEGYVAFQPVAFIFLLLTLFAGRHYVFWWTHQAYPVKAKAVYFNPAFLTIRDIVIYALMVSLAVWYIYTSLRLDVGRLPERGASWAANIRARMRSGFGDERREIHSACSTTGS